MATPETNREIIERLSRENQQLREEARALLGNVEQLSRHVELISRLDEPDIDPFTFDLEDNEGA